MLVNKKDECPYFTAFGLPGDGLRYKEIFCELIELFNRSAYDDFCIPFIYELSLIHDIESVRFQDKTITLREFYDNEGGWLSEPGTYLGVNKIKTNFGNSIHLCDELKKHSTLITLTCIGISVALIIGTIYNRNKIR